VVQAAQGDGPDLHARPSRGAAALPETRLPPGGTEEGDGAADELRRACSERHALATGGAARCPHPAFPRQFLRQTVLTWRHTQLKVVAGGETPPRRWSGVSLPLKR